MLHIYKMWVHIHYVLHIQYIYISVKTINIHVSLEVRGGGGGCPPHEFAIWNRTCYLSCLEKLDKCDILFDARNVCAYIWFILLCINVCSDIFCTFYFVGFLINNIFTGESTLTVLQHYIEFTTTPSSSMPR